MGIEAILPKKKEEGITLEIMTSVIKTKNGHIGVLLKKQITDPENVAYFIKNCLNKDAIIARIVFKDKFLTKVNLAKNGYKIDDD